MSDTIYHVNGRLVPADEATIPVRDRGFLYGDAGFETLRVYDGELFEWSAHLDRLSSTCALLEIDHDITAADLRRRITETLEANGLTDAYVRVSITRGIQPGKLTPHPVTEPGVVIIVSELPPGGPGNPPVWDGPASVTIADTRRTPDESIPAEAKTHNYLNGILARLEARRAGTDEAILCDSFGAITEGATSNCFFVSDGTLHTPSLDGPVLPGVTRAVVQRLADGRNLPHAEGSYGVEDLLDADEAFLTNTTWEIRPISTVDGTEIGSGSTTTELQHAFDEYVISSTSS